MSVLLHTSWYKSKSLRNNNMHLFLILRLKWQCLGVKCCGNISNMLLLLAMLQMSWHKSKNIRNSPCCCTHHGSKVASWGILYTCHGTKARAWGNLYAVAHMAQKREHEELTMLLHTTWYKGRVLMNFPCCYTHQGKKARAWGISYAYSPFEILPLSITGMCS